MEIRDLPNPDKAAPSVVFNATPSLAVKTVACLVLSTVGIYYLTVGKKQRDLQKMIVGAVLILASLFIF